ncbi:putative peptidoglycan binding domain containing protein [Neofusicoccum parvum UCRNP2]|uniref:Putative peptidoglycan binding domain containing protein n=1 Tax=Botryosphaeria parva (strain UCR-NP2) TaxID=1287680 RepID=R1G977_BOTPV|nr:putative peptidoglycan binding domain containing protein [Neofusicoccum parvum UCRNP2]
MIAPNDIDEKTGKTIEQVVYYQTGIGAGQMTRLDSVWQGATGAGLEENVTTAYHYLANNYLSGKSPNEADEIFLFGFSRGAYTARALADLYKVYKEHGNRKDEGATNTKARKDSAVGNGENGYESDNSTVMKNTGKFWKSAMKMANSIDRKIWDRIKQFHPDNDSEKSHIVHTIKIKVIGVWDTVGSRGLPESLLTWATGWNKKYQFHDTALNRSTLKIHFQEMRLG